MMGNTGDGSVGHRPEWCESSCQSGNLSFFQTQIALCYRSIGSNVRLILFLSNTENRPLCYKYATVVTPGSKPLEIVAEVFAARSNNHSEFISEFIAEMRRYYEKI